ncbi:chromosomal replication initiator protein DnaA [Ruminococcus sp. Marseille-P6503]|uniref:chromosomal replication initiator protein DnaA n=1 Tax=Ruminococcus sp. Marseille-P6503 TaxID=2364796 RepID=UPI000F52B1CB|nr:chromosomal replication initiator protein DnaA [Ruminococcus sp. Marseille-P6503]
MDSFNEAFQSVLKYCEADPSVSEIGFNKWIKILEPFKLENNTAFLLTDSEFTKKTTTEVYEDVLKRAFLEVLGFDVDIRILVKAKAENTDDIPQEPAPTVSSPTKYSSSLTFDNFVKGKSNELAYAFSIAVAGKNDTSGELSTNQAFNPLFIYGDSGLGKTHLMKAIENEVKKKKPDINLIYTTGENFMNELVKAIEYKQTISFHDKYRNADFLLVDDVQSIAGKERIQEEFFHTFNDLYNAGKQIVLTSDIAPSKISKLENRIRSRFSLGVQVDIQPPDFETRMAIVKRKAEVLDLQLTDNISRIIAEKIKANIRQLEGTVNKMKALTIYTNEQPSISMAQRVIKEIMIENHPAEITVDRIISDVATAFKVTPDDIRSTNRRANISLARKITIYLLKEVKGMTYIQIGNELNKNHSTMTIHYQDVAELLKKNSDLKETVDDIIKNLKDV